MYASDDLPSARAILISSATYRQRRTYGIASVRFPWLVLKIFGDNAQAQAFFDAGAASGVGILFPRIHSVLSARPRASTQSKQRVGVVRTMR